MDRGKVNAKRELPRHFSGRKRGECIRIGRGGAHEGEPATRPTWMTLEEAEAVLVQLTEAIRREKAARITGTPKAA